MLGDIENALTTLNEIDADDEAKKIVRASIRAYFFDNVIMPNFALLAPVPTGKASEVLRSYAILGQTLNRILLRRRSTLLSKKVNLFTTNIDLVFEVSFERLGVEFNDGFTGKIRPTFDMGSLSSLRYRSGVRYEHLSEIPTFDLYKLHGSIGWELLDDPTTTSDIAFDRSLTGVAATRDALEALRPELIPIVARGDVDAATLLQHADGLTLSAKHSAFSEAYDRLVIVNPEKQKFATTVLTETYYELIRRFANELEKENSALIVHGFSFRDEHLRKLIVRAARTNPTLQVLVFCYTASDRVSYETLIPELDVPNGNFTYITPPDVDSDPPIVFDLDTVVERYLAPLIPEPQRRPDGQIELIFKTDDGEDT
ncbi:SIR2 family protein [Rhodococcus sp. USK13]|uniref:SIR2 family protein n=1 Tax=Rhodococcus sp. USK13 TaxID=2806442 RepID=UPI001BCA8E9A|nr:SIR2 family protein [Rhodococcus sp. USK13]